MLSGEGQLWVNQEKLMSLSLEKQDYHLTLEGWVEGSFLGDVLGGKNIVEVPKDTGA